MAEDFISEVKRKATDQEKLFSKHITEEELIL